jgi:uncharacterized protein (DUF1330 family)
MGLFDQLDLHWIKEAYRADIPTPVDVLNLIHFKDEEAYKWYGVMAIPVVWAVGAELGWMGKHVESFLGEPRAEELLVVRYPNQRRFLALALNPYYAIIANPQRLKGVKKFEASFTHSPDSLESLRRSRWVLAVHFHEATNVLARVLEAAGAQRVYQSVETSPIKIAKRAHPANTNPLLFKRTVLFRFETQAACDEALSPGVLNDLRKAANELSVQLYRRVSRKDALPAAVARLGRRL